MTGSEKLLAIPVRALIDFPGRKDKYWNGNAYQAGQEHQWRVEVQPVFTEIPKQNYTDQECCHRCQGGPIRILHHLTFNNLLYGRVLLGASGIVTTDSSGSMLDTQT